MLVSVFSGESIMRMKVWTFIILLCCVRSSADEPTVTTTEVSGESIAKAIERLDHPDFNIRTQASNELLEIGEKAKHALQEVIKNGSVESSQRAKRILDDMELGIGAGTSDDQASLLRMFGASNQAERANQLAEMLIRGEFELVPKLIDRIHDRSIKQALFQKSFNNSDIMRALVESQKLDWWVQKASEVDSTANRHDLVIAWLRRPDVLQELEVKDDLRIIEELFAQEPHDDSRFQLAKRLMGQRAFMHVFMQGANIDHLLRLIDLRDSAARQTLIVQLIRSEKQTPIQTGTLRKILQFSNKREPAETVESKNIVRLTLLEALFPASQPKSQVKASDFIELHSDLTEAEIEQSLKNLFQLASFKNWLLDPENFRPLLDWAATLPAPARNDFVIRVNQAVNVNNTFVLTAFENPSTLDFYWQLIERIEDEKAKTIAKINLAPLLILNTHFQTSARKQSVDLVLSTFSPQTDIALDAMLRQDSFAERIYDDNHIKDVLVRCSRFDVTENQTLLDSAFSRIFAANSLRAYFKDTSNSDWLMETYLPSLTPAIRDAATKAICRSARLLQTWGNSPHLDAVLEHATKLTNPNDRVECIVSILRMDTLIDLPENDRKLPLLTMFRDESLPVEVRANFIKAMSGSPAYLAWLTKTNQAVDFIDTVEKLSSKPSDQLASLYSSPTFFSFLASQNRLDQWFEHCKGDSTRTQQALSMFMNPSTPLSVEIVDSKLEELVRLTEFVNEPKKRGEFLAAILFSPASLEVHKRDKKFGDLLQRLNTQKHPEVKIILCRAMCTMDVMNLLIEAGQAGAIVELANGTPLDRASAVIPAVLHPMVVEYLVKHNQMDNWFNLVLANKIGRAYLFQNSSVIRILVHHGYLERLLEIAGTEENRAAVTAQLLSDPGAVNSYVTDGRVLELVKLFSQLEPGMPRDTALRGLFLRPDSTKAVCRELGVEETYALVNTIQYSFYLTYARANVVIASCSLGKVPEAWLSQLIGDMGDSGFLNESRRLELLTEEVGGQILAAGMLPKLKERFAKVNQRSNRSGSHALNDYYSSPLVLEYLNANGQMEEFVAHTQSIRDPIEIGDFVDRLLASSRGCQIMLSSKGVPTLLEMAGVMSGYYQSHFWERFCTKPSVIDFVLESDDSDALLQFLTSRKQTEHEFERLVVQIAQHKRLKRLAKNKTLVKHLVGFLPKATASTQTSVASNVSNNATLVWAMVESDQWDALSSLVQCEASPNAKTTRWNEFVWKSGGVVHALIANAKTELAMELLQKAENSSDGLINDLLWLRLANGTLNEQIAALESQADSLQLKQWRWLALAYRAKGEDEKAKAAATKAADRGLLTALAIERSDWATAASILQDSSAPFAGLSPSNDEELKLEHQGMLLLARRYAGQTDQLQMPIDTLIELRTKSTNARVRSRCCDALLLAEQFPPALSFIDEQIPHRALRLRLHQHEYALAINAMKWNPDDPKSFLTKVRQSTGNDLGMIHSTAELLRALNHEEKHHDMRMLHEALIQWLLEKPSGFQRSQPLGFYASQLYRNGLVDLFWATLPHIDASGVLLYSNLLAGTTNDEVARTFSLYLPALMMERSVGVGDQPVIPVLIDRLRIAESILQSGEASEDQLKEWLQRAIGPHRNVYMQPEVAFTLGVLCLKQERLDDAKSVLEPLIDAFPLAALALARDAWSRQDWIAASTYFDRFHRGSSDRIEAIYLSGLALSRSEQSKAGAEKMEKALLVNYQPVSQLRLAFELQRLGETELANDLARKVVRIASHHSYSHLEAIMHLIDNSSSSQEVASWCQQWQFVQSRYKYGNGEQTEFLRVPLKLHNALAEQALSDKDWDRLSEELKICKAIGIKDESFAQRWTERLLEAGQKTLADAWKQE